MRNKQIARVFVGVSMFVTTSEIAGLSAEKQIDPRVVLLHQFLEGKDCPIKNLAPDFIEAADRHGLDWRLLPSISFVESSGGKYFKRNNIFGWENANRRFLSVRHGIHSVANYLGTLDCYRNKDLNGILKTYNPRPAYALRVKEVMAAIGPERPAD